jgi:hypothetical protein
MRATACAGLERRDCGVRSALIVLLLVGCTTKRQSAIGMGIGAGLITTGFVVGEVSSAPDRLLPTGGELAGSGIMVAGGITLVLSLVSLALGEPGAPVKPPSSHCMPTADLLRCE